MAKVRILEQNIETGGHYLKVGTVAKVVEPEGDLEHYFVGEGMLLVKGESRTTGDIIKQALDKTEYEIIKD